MYKIGVLHHEMDKKRKLLARTNPPVTVVHIVDNGLKFDPGRC